MNEQERHTHFQGFAELLYPELAKLFARRMLSNEKAETVVPEIKTLLAQRAYDLVEHTIDFTIGQGPGYTPPDASYVPDLDAWPEQ